MNEVTNYALLIIQFLVYAFVFALSIGALIIAWMYIVDITQTKHTIRRNYPVIGRFRYFFEHLGEFFRQYFSSMDREELPFNRAERSWVYRAAKDIDSTIAFGSTRPLSQPGDIIFLNCPFPTLKEDSTPVSGVTIGAGTARIPYTTYSIYNISGMSYGAISKPAVEALASGAKKAGIWMNTGEGGLSAYHLNAGCDLVFQIGTAKYGVRTADGALSDEKLKEIAGYKQVRMFEIKMSQGAKPGKGGILPGVKVTAEIARIRGIEEGSDSLSPNGHPDIKRVEDLLDMIEHIREVTGKPVGFKAVIGTSDWLDDLCKEIHSRGIQSAPDFVTIDSADGGTGAAPQSLMDYMGLPLRKSLPLIVDKLNYYNLRNQIKVICSGKLITPADVAWAFCVGADFVVSARGFMFALGCIQAMQCNKNTCPTGITTHNEKLQHGLNPANKAERVANYVKNMVYEVGIIAHSCGVREPRQLRRHHAHMIVDEQYSKPLEEVFPTVEPAKDYMDKN